MEKKENDWQHLNYNIHENIIQTINRLEFRKPTPVQVASIPLLSQNKDVAVEAVTGSGKTLAFVVPALEIMLRVKMSSTKPQVLTLVISPTRELAMQINEVFDEFLKELPQFSKVMLIGGINIKEDIQRLQTGKFNIVVATPGRLEELLDRKNSQSSDILLPALKSLELLVLDEADRILDLGFETSINVILNHLPKQRRTGLFSATQTDKLLDLLRAGLRNPIKIRIVEKEHEHEADSKIPLSLKINAMICAADQKFNQLVYFLKSHKSCKHIVFFSTCASVDYFGRAIKQLLPKHIKILLIHGKMKSKRGKIFEKFRKLESGVLICTDVMARGVDIPNVHYVLQFDPPSQASSFVHRCGRTARIGNEGHAVVFLLPIEDTYIEFISINQKVPIGTIEPRDGIANSSEKLRKICTKDRSMYEKSMRAFVSFIQSYSKHDCSLIFRFKDLDIPKLAAGFGLLHLPAMPELKNKTFPEFKITEIDYKSIPYKQDDREKERLETLEKIKTGEIKKKDNYRPKSKSWELSREKDKAQKDRRNKRRMAKERKRKAKEELSQDDLDDLTKDTNLLKKLKRNKMTEEQFDEEFTKTSEPQETENMDT